MAAGGICHKSDGAGDCYTQLRHHVSRLNKAVTTVSSSVGILLPVQLTNFTAGRWRQSSRLLPAVPCWPAQEEGWCLQHPHNPAALSLSSTWTPAQGTPDAPPRATACVAAYMTFRPSRYPLQHISPWPWPHPLPRPARALPSPSRPANVIATLPDAHARVANNRADQTDTAQCSTDAHLHGVVHPDVVCERRYSTNSQMSVPSVSGGVHARPGGLAATVWLALASQVIQLSLTCKRRPANVWQHEVCSCGVHLQGAQPSALSARQCTTDTFFHGLSNCQKAYLLKLDCCGCQHPQKPNLQSIVAIEISRRHVHMLHR